MLYFYFLIYSSTTLPDCFTYNFKSSPLLKQKSTAMTESWPKSTRGAERTPQMWMCKTHDPCANNCEQSRKRRRFYTLFHLGSCCISLCYLRTCWAFRFLSCAMNNWRCQKSDLGISKVFTMMKLKPTADEKQEIWKAEQWWAPQGRPTASTCKWQLAVMGEQETKQKGEVECKKHNNPGLSSVQANDLIPWKLLKATLSSHRCSQWWPRSTWGHSAYSA